MSQVMLFLWPELSHEQQQRVINTFGVLDMWLRMPRMRASSIAIAFDGNHPCAISIVSHDRVRIGVSIVDVATVRHAAKAEGHADDLLVELLMHQAQSLLDEGIGIVLVKGNVAYWSQFGFAPISLDVETRWSHTVDIRAVEPGSVQVGPLSSDDRELVRGIAMAQSSTHIEFVEIDAPSQLPWMTLRSRDGQLRAAAELKHADANLVVSRAVASDDGAAYDLIAALLDHTNDAMRLTLQLAPNHSLSRMALEHRANTQIALASSTALMAGVIDLPKMLEALIPSFRQRLATSQYADWTGGVRVEIRDERAMIMFGPDGVHVIDGTREASVRIKQVEVSALAQMAFGYRSISALRRAGLLHCDDTELSLCEAIFPSMTPVLDV